MPITKRSRPFSRALLMGAALCVLAACAADEDEVAYVERPVEELYNEAFAQLQAEEYAAAATQFDEVERQHPYSVWATKSQLMAAYAFYMEDQYDDAIIALDRFIRLHPSNRDTPYAYYLKGLSYYEQISDVGRDQKMSEEARQAFTDLVRRYPQSQYTKDASLKLDLIEDHLAGKEMEIGRYYTSRGQCLAAINRFRQVVATYDTTTHVPEALHRLTECYLTLGMTEEAQKTAAILGHNFPGSEWYIDSYQIVERVRIRDEAQAPWYWPFEQKDALQVLEEADGQQATPGNVGPDARANPTPQEDLEQDPWWKFW